MDLSFEGQTTKGILSKIYVLNERFREQSLEYSDIMMRVPSGAENLYDLDIESLERLEELKGEINNTLNDLTKALVIITYTTTMQDNGFQAKSEIDNILVLIAGEMKAIKNNSKNILSHYSDKEYLGRVTTYLSFMMKIFGTIEDYSNDHNLDIISFTEALKKREEREFLEIIAD